MPCTRAAVSQAVCKQTPGHLSSRLPPKHSCWALSQLQPSGGGTKAPLLTLSLAAEGRLGSLGTLLASVRKGKWKKQPCSLLVVSSSSPWFSGSMKPFIHSPDICQGTLASVKPWTRLWGLENETQLLASRSSQSGEVDGRVHSQVLCTQKWKVGGASRGMLDPGEGSQTRVPMAGHWTWCLKMSSHWAPANQNGERLAQAGSVWNSTWWEEGGDEGRGQTGRARL